MLKPLGTKILVERLPDETVTSGGLVIPDKFQHTGSKKDYARGRILALGPGKQLKDGTVRPIDLKQGDVILFDFFKCIKIPFGDQVLIATREEDVLCEIGLED